MSKKQKEAAPQVPVAPEAPQPKPDPLAVLKEAEKVLADLLILNLLADKPVRLKVGLLLKAIKAAL